MKTEKQKREIKGYSVKSPKNNGNYYIYIWDKRTYDSDEVKAERERKGTRNYSKVKGWKSLGNINNPASWVKLYNHLNKMYGSVDEQEVKDYLEEKQKELEQKQKEEFKKYRQWIADYYHRLGITDAELPTDLKQAKKVWKLLNK